MAISTRSKLVWDPRFQIYRWHDEVVSWRDVRKMIDSMVATSGRRLFDLGAQVKEGRLSVSRWQTLAAKEIKNLHTATFTIATGGKNQLGFSNLGRLGNAMEFQFRHLNDFAATMPRVSDRSNVIPSRLESYGAAAIGTYENERLDRSIIYGLSLARRNTAHGVASCEVCLIEEDAGWQDIKTIRRIGDSPCGARCNCDIETEEVRPL